MFGASQRAIRVAAAAVVAAISSAAPAVSQAADSAAVPSRAVFGSGDLVVAGAVAAGTVLASYVDRPIADLMQSPGLHRRAVSRASHVAELLAVPGALIIGAGLYGGGRLAHDAHTAELGLRGVEAMAIAGGADVLLKFATGRTRPFVGHERTHDFAFGRGTQGDEYRSFPSGHTVIAFAIAAVATEETRRWSPGATWYVGSAVYGTASLVGLARMYNDKHWLSDVVLGAAIGTYAGVKVVRWHSVHPRSRLDRWLLGVRIAPAERGGHRVDLLLAPVRSDR